MLEPEPEPEPEIEPEPDPELEPEPEPELEPEPEPALEPKPELEREPPTAETVNVAFTIYLRAITQNQNVNDLTVTINGDTCEGSREGAQSCFPKMTCVQ